jgi:outer membrane protein assembly factor BamB
MKDFRLAPSLVILIIFAFCGCFLPVETDAQTGVQSPNGGRAFSKCWELNDSSIQSFASDNGKIITTDSEGNLRLYENSPDEQIWRISIGEKFETKLLTYRNRLFLLNHSPNGQKETTADIREIDVLTGITRWTLPLKGTGKPYLLGSISEEKPVLISIFENHVYSIDPENGKLLWDMKIEQGVKSFTSGSKFLFVLDKENSLLRIGLENGTALKNSKLKIKDISTIAHLNGRTLFIGTKNGSLYELSVDSSDENRVLRTGGEISFLITAGENVLAASNDNFLYLYSSKEKDVLWKKRLAGRITVSPLVRNGTVAVTSPSEPKIYFLNLPDGAVFNQIDLPEDFTVDSLEAFEDEVLVLGSSSLLRFSAAECRR